MHFLDKYLWGKSTPYKHLSRHMMDAGACAAVYLSSASMTGMASRLANLMGISAGDAIAFLSYLASIHDLGKAFPHFVRSSEEQYAQIPEEIKKSIFPERRA